jgi:type II secretory pathway predicted ATPase ExeA
MRPGTLAALEQRITVRRHMTGMTSEETAGYIRHHLQLAGRSDPLFTDDANLCGSETIWPVERQDPTHVG